ncbi:unnamed protein product [Rotaria magnacalcarata]|uniref:P2X purinoceptor n=5 Tax=Rotaria magnacalcarata TaxID=392030 RepID=A0A814RPF3_9BILA|nr:unnamed protein product [Rotaria magnacalcarata]CAF3802819.1 unnamed protein product [Rotaria magnacalcarata]
MSGEAPVITVQCLSLREYFSASNMKSIFRSFVYEYETPKIVTIHSISIALMCRLIQVLILIYGIAYLMIHKKGYQETNTSIISSITLKVKGIGYNQTGPNQTLVIDGADYIVPPQENNALFLMTNFIRTDQEHKRCAESPDEKESACSNDSQCQLNKEFRKANGKWSGRCLINPTSAQNKSSSGIGRCELEGWCPVENDRDIPNPIRDALNFTIFVKNFIEFPRFKVIRKNIQQNASYLKKCNYDRENHKICPIFRVATILDIVEPDPTEQMNMLKFGGVIRVKIDWKCNLDKSLDHCLPEYSFGRLDGPYKEETFSQGFNFRFASHWKHQDQSFRTLTKAFGLRFIISVSGHAGRFDVITLSLNIGSLIGILGLATFICDIVALYVHRQSDVYRQQKFQDVDLNLLRLETLNSLTEGMINEVAKRKQQALLTDHVVENNDAISIIDSPHKEKFRRNVEQHPHNLHHQLTSSPSVVRKNSAASPELLRDDYHQRPVAYANSLTDSPSSSSSVKHRRSITTRPPQLTSLPKINHEEIEMIDKVDIDFADEDSPIVSGHKQLNELKSNLNIKSSSLPTTGQENLKRPPPKLETFL